MKSELIDDALNLFQNQKYGSAAERLGKAGEGQLQAECERLHELLGNHAEMLGGRLGQVISNYEDRIIADLAQKAEEVED